MTHPNPATALARVVIDELAHQGVRLVVISPGSRSGALAIAAAGHAEIETRVVIDERSAAFHALGAARASSAPTAVLTTSGTAPANMFGAVVEADMSCVPLIAVSADRPAEMQGIGANQTIDQEDLFGSKVRGYVGIEAPAAGENGNRAWRETVAGLVSMATGGRPGPVHLNVRFREPTVPVVDDGRTKGEPYPLDTPRIEWPSPRDSRRAGGFDLHFGGDRGVVVAGDGEYDRHELAARAAELGWPVLATALSGMRGGRVVSSYHHLLAAGVPPDLRPETVVAVGAIGPSSRLDGLVAAASNRVMIDRWGRVIDPGRNATHVLSGDVIDLLACVEGHAGADWLQTWLSADERCRARIDELLQDTRGMSGAGIASALNAVDWGSLVVASSLPIREVDAHLVRGGAVFANRGASGIDGFVSTALGVAGARPRTLALAGDLSLLHDANGFLCDSRIDLTLVVVDNGGGGLFDSLPQARHAPDYERLFVTPPQRRFETLARLNGLRYAEAKDPEDLWRLANEALDRPGIDLIRVEVDRDHDLSVRAQLDG